MGHRPALRVLEFYSGIGGMHYALPAQHAVVLAAFDVNHAANAVYEHNFGQTPKQVDLAAMTAAELDAYAAELWLMAPPCQPFTRQGKQLGAADSRSSSFLHLLAQLQLMRVQPQGLLVENVVGFQGSDVHTQLVAALAKCGYNMQEFILTPTQYGVPYSRPRYFCVASKQPLPVPVPGLQQPCLCTPALLVHLQQQGAGQERIKAGAQQHGAAHVEQVPTLGEYLSLHLAQQPDQQQQQPIQQCPQPSQQQQQQQQQSPPAQQQRQASSCPGQADVMTGWRWVPDKVLQRHADVIDVATAASRSCNCFTKAYGHFARGTGSLLATVADPSAVDARWQLVDGCGSLELRGYVPPPLRRQSSSGSGSAVNADTTAAAEAAVAAADRAGCADNGAGEGEGRAGGGSECLAAAWQQLRLRYFTVREIARLHSFPDSFSLPAGFSSRQGYQLLGNSLSVAVVADLLAYLCRSFTSYDRK